MGKKTREIENKKYKFYLREEAKIIKKQVKLKIYKLCNVETIMFHDFYECPNCGEMTSYTSQECIFCENCDSRFNVCGYCNDIDNKLIYCHLLEWAIEYDEKDRIVSSIQPTNTKYYLELNEFEEHNIEYDCSYGLNWYCPRCHNDEILFPD